MIPTFISVDKPGVVAGLEGKFIYDPVRLRLQQRPGHLLTV